jgi:hypothetical protein
VLRLVPHVERDDNRFVPGEKFDCQKKTTFQAGGVNDVDDHVGLVQQ